MRKGKEAKNVGAVKYACVNHRDKATCYETGKEDGSTVVKVNNCRVVCCRADATHLQTAIDAPSTAGARRTTNKMSARIPEHAR